MYCQKCGEQLQPGAAFCVKCGASISAVKPSEYPSSQNIPTSADTPIWNPNVAVNWSLIFTPALGSYLHALNWRTLGEQDRAKSAMRWFYFSLGIPVVYLFTNGSVGILYLVIWYLFAGRLQGKYVKGKYGSDYPRRPWGKPLLIGVAALVGYFIIGAVALSILSTAA